MTLPPAASRAAPAARPSHIRFPSDSDSDEPINDDGARCGLEDRDLAGDAADPRAEPGPGLYQLQDYYGSGSEPSGDAGPRRRDSGARAGDSGSDVREDGGAEQKVASQQVRVVD